MSGFIASDMLELKTQQALRSRRRRFENRVVSCTIFAVLLAGAAAGVFVYSKTPELTDRAPSRATQAIQSAALVTALAGGAITLWLSNRRRRHDEETLEQSREELEQARSSSADELELNRTRAEDERFTAAIELLGHENSSVRVGALHALHGLATTAAPRRQTIVDVMSAYLRQPFHHRDWGAPPTGFHLESPGIQDREREVRRTAMRLIIELLGSASEDDLVLVDLTRAALDDLDLRGRTLHLRAAGANFHGDVELESARFPKETTFEGAVFHGEVDMMKTSFFSRANFESARFNKEVWFVEASFHAFATFNRTHFDDDAHFDNVDFLKGISTSDAVFTGRASFAGVTVSEHGYFINTDFHSEPRFGRTRFKGTAMFARSIFYRGSSFTEAIFDHGGDFIEADFMGDADFSGLTIGATEPEALVNFHLAKFGAALTIENTEPSKLYFGRATFTYAHQRPK